VRVALGAWFVLVSAFVVVAVLCYGWLMLQRDFFRLCCVLCRPVFLGRLHKCACWFPARIPPSFALPPFASLCDTESMSNSICCTRGIAEWPPRGAKGGSALMGFVSDGAGDDGSLGVHACTTNGVNSVLMGRPNHCTEVPFTELARS
jgi:hypothetical protein